MNRIKCSIRKHFGLVLVATATCLVLGVVLMLALTGADGTSHAAPVSPSPTTLPGASGAGASASGAKGKHPAVRGAVTAISGETWSVTVKGVAITVTVTPETRYGTKAAPLAATDFAVGNEVTVVGSRTGTTVSATRIAHAPTSAGAARSTTVPSTPAAA
ncbi:MAG: hypothetical protein QOF30_2549 [Acidimicrobiaceae bacterium]|jgi:hypothetical protein|nr:hypothetical protein [Acidimicrobiaceae bacterium]